MSIKCGNLPPHNSEELLQKSSAYRTLDRRTLLAVAGSTVAAGLGTSFPGSSEAVTGSWDGMRRIDAHTHFSSLKYLDALEKQQGRPFALSEMYRQKPALTDPKARLNLLDRTEVDIHVLVPVPWLEAFPRVATDRTLAPQLARLMNDELAAVVANRPTRFRGVAVLPTVDPDAMVTELHRAVKELGFLGAYLAVGPTAKRMDHPHMEPLFRAIVELDATLWLHPSRPPLPDHADETVSKYYDWLAIGWPHDTTSAMFRLVFSGVFDRYPTIRIVTHHHGGFVPYYAPRMTGVWDAAEETGPALDTKITKPYIDHFRKFYCDTACNEFAPKALELAVDFFGFERTVYGSDSPFGPDDGQHFTREALRSIEAMRISADARKAILFGTASRILNIP
jgi:aminocarboxymuconate-semialdehyde decarboxylase